MEDPSQCPFTIPSIQSMRRISLDHTVTVLVGENGSGKSTLIEAVAVGAGLNAEGGSRNLRLSTRPSHSSLHEHLTLSWRGRPRRAFFLRAESFYNVASAYEQLFPTSLHEHSHGESFIEAMQRHEALIEEHRARRVQTLAVPSCSKAIALWSAAAFMGAGISTAPPRPTVLMPA